MNKIKKSLLAIATIATVVSPLSAVVACGGTSGGGNAGKDSKEIVITVDPAFTNVYDHVIADFNASDYHTKDGYYIKKVVKGSQDVLNTIATIGFTEDQVGDILYLPFDKIPDLLQKRSVMPGQEEDMKEFMEGLGFSDKTPAGGGDSELVTAYKKGVSTMGDQKYPFLIPHNKEGILYFSKKAISDTPDLIEEATAGTGAYKLADGGYGLGVIGSVLGNDMDKIVTKTGDKGQSIFIDKNSPSKYTKYAGDIEYTVKAREAVDKMAEMWASYIDNTSSDATYADLYQQDPSASMNAVLALADAGKVTSALATVDQMTNFIQHGFVDVSGDFTVGAADGSTKDQYLGAPGGGLFGINARDNGADSKRISAIKSIIKDLYSDDSAKLFYEDDKVPYSDKAYQAVKTVESKENSAKIDSLLKLFKITPPTAEENKMKSSDKIEDYASKMASSVTNQKAQGKAFSDWATAFAAQQKLLASYDRAGALISDGDAGLNEVGDNPTTPAPVDLDTKLSHYAEAQKYLKDSGKSTKILGAQGLAKLLLGVGSEKGLYIDPDNGMMHLFKTDADKAAAALVPSLLEKGDDDKYTRNGNGLGAIHPRKVLSQIIGDGGTGEFGFADGDIDGKKTLDQNAAPFIAKAKAKLGSKLTSALEDDIKAYVNTAYLPKALQEGKTVATTTYETTSKSPEGSAKAYMDITTGGLKAQILEAMQTVTTSASRPDASNPQFGHVFGQAWDDLMFGHKTWFAQDDVTKAAKAATKSDAGMNAGKEMVGKHIGTAFGSRIVTLDVVGAQSTIS